MGIDKITARRNRTYCTVEVDHRIGNVHPLENTYPKAQSITSCQQREC